jgi:hypothetical protein
MLIQFKFGLLTIEISSNGQNCSILSQNVPKFELYKHNDELFKICYRILYEQGTHPGTNPARFDLTWFSGFREEDLNVIFYQICLICIIGIYRLKEKFPPFFLFLAWWPSWLEVGINGHNFERGPYKYHSTKVWLHLAQWIPNFNCSYMARSSLTYIPGFSVKFFFQPIYTDYAN